MIDLATPATVYTAYCYTGILYTVYILSTVKASTNLKCDECDYTAPDNSVLNDHKNRRVSIIRI